MPYIPGGSVAYKLDTYYASGQVKVSKTVKQFLNGIHTIKQAGIMHRNIKPAIVLVDSSTLKFADFNYYTQQDTSNQYSISTDCYITPEVVQMATCSMKVDTFAENDNEKLLLLWRSVLMERDGNNYLETSQIEDTLNSYEVLQEKATLRSLTAYYAI